MPENTLIIPDITNSKASLSFLHDLNVKKVQLKTSEVIPVLNHCISVIQDGSNNAGIFTQKNQKYLHYILQLWKDICKIEMSAIPISTDLIQKMEDIIFTPGFPHVTQNSPTSSSLNLEKPYSKSFQKYLTLIRQRKKLSALTLQYESYYRFRFHSYLPLEGSCMGIALSYAEAFLLKAERQNIECVRYFQDCIKKPPFQYVYLKPSIQTRFQTQISETLHYQKRSHLPSINLEKKGIFHRSCFINHSLEGFSKLLNQLKNNGNVIYLIEAFTHCLAFYFKKSNFGCHMVVVDQNIAGLKLSVYSPSQDALTLYQYAYLKKMNQIPSQPRFAFSLHILYKDPSEEAWINQNFPKLHVPSFLELKNQRSHHIFFALFIKNSQAPIDDTLLQGINLSYPIKQKTQAGTMLLTPLICICNFRNNKDIQKALEKCNSHDVNMQNHEGLTPLMFYNFQQDLSVLDAFIQKNMNPNLITKKGDTLFTFLIKEREDILALNWIRRIHHCSKVPIKLSTINQILLCKEIKNKPLTHYYASLMQQECLHLASIKTLHCPLPLVSLPAHSFQLLKTLSCQLIQIEEKDITSLLQHCLCALQGEYPIKIFENTRHLKNLLNIWEAYLHKKDLPSHLEAFVIAQVKAILLLPGFPFIKSDHSFNQSTYLYDQLNSLASETLDKLDKQYHAHKSSTEAACN